MKVREGAKAWVCTGVVFTVLGADAGLDGRYVDVVLSGFGLATTISGIFLDRSVNRLLNWQQRMLEAQDAQLKARRSMS